jgi:beta-N-acetylhexosaminidase
MSSPRDPYPRRRRPTRPIPHATRHRDPRLAFLPTVILASAVVLVAIIGILARGGGHARHATSVAGTPASVAGAATLAVSKQHHHSGSPNPATRVLEHDLGESIVTRLTGTAATPALLARVRAGEVGGVILFTENFAAGTGATSHAISQLQRAARTAGTWPLLIMTDQEGGEVRRLAGAPPRLAPAQMTSAQVAREEGLAAGNALQNVGINVDLAPVADVEQIQGSFLDARSFGPSPLQVAQRACAFAQGLNEAGVGYTLKHFPGLGTATASTDDTAVAITTQASQLRTNYAAYRRCGHGARTLVMISSASYPSLTGTEAPALDAPEIYKRELHQAGIQAVTVSDDLQAAALAGLKHPALHALSAGLDLLLYAQSEQVSQEAYEKLDAELHRKSLSATRVRQAAAAITRLKGALAK